MLLVQHNIAGIMTARNLMINNRNRSKNLEKLASGYRVNRAGDDAAGLAISEGMRAKIRGINQAAQNAKDGISMIHTAEGAMDEITSMLQRMHTLSIKAMNCNMNDENRILIDEEITQLKKEITRITEHTEFNGTQVLLDALPGQGSAVEADSLPLPGGSSADAAVASVFSDSREAVVLSLPGTGAASSEEEAAVADAKAAVADADAAIATFSDSAASYSEAMAAADSSADTDSGIFLPNGAGTDTSKIPADLTFQIGPSSVEKLDIHLPRVGLKALGLENMSLMTVSDAADACDALKVAINHVSAERGRMGGLEMRMEHAIRNLEVTSDNMVEAESRIRDTDMADEVTAFTKNNILFQAASIVMSQANSQPESVMALLS